MGMILDPLPQMIRKMMGITKNFVNEKFSKFNDPTAFKEDEDEPKV